MKITFVNRMMGILRGGGENVDLNLARSLKKLGVQVRFVVGRRLSQLDEPLEEFDTHYIATPYLRPFDYRHNHSKFRVLRAMGTRLRMLDNHLFTRAAFRYLRHDKSTDVYQVCALPHLAVALADIGRKSVIRWPGPPSDRTLAMVSKSSVMVANGYALQSIQQRSAAPIYDVPVGCATDFFAPKPNRKIESNLCRFLWVGRFIPIKNVPFLIRGFSAAYRQHSRIRLTLVGEGQGLNQAGELARRCGVAEAVTFTGQQTGEALLSHYQSADCFVITSTFDNYPNVVLEAMSCALPVIGTRVGGIPLQVKQNRTGLLVASDTDDELRDALLDMANHPEKRREMGQQAREWVCLKHQWGMAARTLLEVYQEILKVESPLLSSGTG